MEALILLASVRARDPDRPVVFATPEPGPNWPEAQALDRETETALTEMGADVRRFAPRHFGAQYPYGLKIEGLQVLDPHAPFVFVDTDTLILSPMDQVPFDFSRPSASLRRGPTWPKPQDNGPDIHDIWQSLYDRFGLDFPASQDQRYPRADWRRYLYFNAGFWYYHDASAFFERFLGFALSVRSDPPPELAGQSLDPWLDQVVLPLVVHDLNGARDALPPGLIDGTVTCHWRTLPLFYAQASEGAITFLESICAPNRIKKLLKRHPAAHRMIYRGEGRKLRELYADRDFETERDLRKALKSDGFWIR